MHGAYLRWSTSKRPKSIGIHVDISSRQQQKLFAGSWSKMPAKKPASSTVVNGRESIWMTSPPWQVKQSNELVDLDQALTKLAAQEPEKAELVKLRYFAGLSIDEAADVLQISRSGKALLGFSRAWLLAELHDADGGIEKS